MKSTLRLFLTLIFIGFLTISYGQSVLAEKHFAKDPEKLKTYKQLSKELDKYRKKKN